jgi:methionyl-tRNA formyltransferase
VQKGGVRIEPGDTTGSLYFRKLYPLGVDAVVEAVRGVATGTARPVPQDEQAATFQGLVDDDVARIDLGRSAEEIDCLVRGCDPQPGAYLRIRGERVRLYDGRLERESDAPAGTVVAVDDDGLALALRGGTLRVGRVRAGAGKEAAGEFAERSGLAPGERVESG